MARTYTGRALVVALVGAAGAGDDEVEKAIKILERNVELRRANRRSRRGEDDAAELAQLGWLYEKQASSSAGQRARRRDRIDPALASARTTLATRRGGGRLVARRRARPVPRVCARRRGRAVPRPPRTTPCTPRPSAACRARRSRRRGAKAVRLPSATAKPTRARGRVRARVQRAPPDFERAASRRGRARAGAREEAARVLTSRKQARELWLEARRPDLRHVGPGCAAAACARGGRRGPRRSPAPARARAPPVREEDLEHHGGVAALEHALGAEREVAALPLGQPRERHSPRRPPPRSRRRAGTAAGSSSSQKNPRASRRAAPESALAGTAPRPCARKSSARPRGRRRPSSPPPPAPRARHRRRRRRRRPRAGDRAQEARGAVVELAREPHARALDLEGRDARPSRAVRGLARDGRESALQPGDGVVRPRRARAARSFRPCPSISWPPSWRAHRI